MATRALLTVGLDPARTPESTWRLFAGTDPAEIRAGLASARERLTARGFAMESLLLGPDDDIGALLRAALAERPYDCVVVGAAVRLDPALTPLLETIVNVLRDAAPGATVCFSTHPANTPDAVARWFPVGDEPGPDG